MVAREAELAELYAWLDRHRPSAANTQSSGGEAPAVGKSERRHIWDVIAGNMKDVPQEDFAALPKDGLSQIERRSQENSVKAVFADTFYWAALRAI